MSFDFFFSLHSFPDFFPFLDDICTYVLQPHLQKSHRTLRFSSLLLRVFPCHGAGYDACQSPLVSVCQHTAFAAGLQNSWLSRREWWFLLASGKDMFQGLPAAQHIHPVVKQMPSTVLSTTCFLFPHEVITAGFPLLQTL